MTVYATPVLASKLRAQAKAMKAGPESLLVQAADLIERQSLELSDLRSQLFTAAQLTAALLFPTDNTDG